MPVTIRPESPADYVAVGEINYRAFDQRLSDPLIVTLTRSMPHYDPSLSLVAEYDGRVVGHALFNPHVHRIDGQDVRGVNLAPIAVDPAFQKGGIGGMLIEEGHRVAREQGYAFSILLGHPTYYPRFGYITDVHGGASISVNLRQFEDPMLQPRPPVEADLPALMQLWEKEEGAVDFAIRPNSSIFSWISPNPLVKSRVYLRDGELVGYTRCRVDQADGVIAFYALDDAAARMMAGLLEIGSGDLPLKLPLHPRSRSAGAFGDAVVERRADAWDAAMVCPLIPGVVDAVIESIRAGVRPPGRVIWGTEFEMV